MVEIIPFPVKKIPFPVKKFHFLFFKLVLGSLDQISIMFLKEFFDPRTGNG